ncbi:DNA-binding transcriptional LysR family regulator [Mumia flava]|uniref:DNA-binding transcriptional LysR family regulator n=1 Tax=Mumia flava TaxID=1348852 RepID=A0A2M9BGI3_9ACTN|nr:LysR family transcriptional regulator [Mumia flava]PJJ57014.1 DNA-binding transcriptional LysR family regulator [Mumia flava]
MNSPSGTHPIDVEKVALLRELAERGSVTAVAAATYRTPSAVSQQIKSLEREMGAPLVVRQGRGVGLTDAGRVLAEGAVEIAEVLERARARFDEFRGSAVGEVSVCAFPSAAELLLPALATRLAKTDPAITLRLRDLDLAEDEFAAITADHDLVIAHSVERVPDAGFLGLSVTPLLREPLDVVVPPDHRLAGRGRVEPAELADEKWIGVPDGFPFDAVLRGLADGGSPIEVVQRFADNHVVAAFVAAGQGIALLPRGSASVATARGLVALELGGVRAGREVYALARPDRAARAAVARVLASLGEVAAELEASVPAPTALDADAPS